ncbi:hypothetical protein S7711_08841 [Stachybotrys chartarum IBT 7711]|uniref:GH16 domain-containing protein n=1 Tax=Stachybotrys chartarum (strain CBS 109288 / IBT 7711) TaxID=1280523 RepID=A0A084AHQ3_STACB|nr:hypothetical protein S7711_08841 [Stachybotrys chartarum IBT 7711]KFA55747.1 hypothetical protein S40293_01908 [Stachybotrys chartarum IBT 40293]
MKSHSFSVLLLAVAPCIAQRDGEQPLLDDGECDCFLTNGSDPFFYSNHLFFDFRDLSSYAGVPDVITNATLGSFAPPTSDYFTSDAWTDVWELQGWNNTREGGDGDELLGDATVLMVNSPNNVYIQQGDDEQLGTFMTLRTKRLPGFQSAAEFQTTNLNYQFLSLRMLARTIGSPGAVTAMFTYRDGEALADVQEADIEILTNGPRNVVQYTNQPSYTADGGEYPEATRNTTMPDDLRWSDWLVHRLDWTPSRSMWYVDGQEVASIEVQTPRDASGVNFNVWSNGGSWSGNMSTYDEAFMQIQWIEMVFNTTEDEEMRRRSTTYEAIQAGPHGRLARRQADHEGCAVVCSIDETSEIGTAALLWESRADSLNLKGVLWHNLARPIAVALGTLFIFCL